MSEFLKKNKRKGLLAMLLFLLRRGKGIGALAVMVLLLSGIFIAPNGFFIDMPFVRGFAEKLGLRSALGGEGGRFRELAEALRSARANRSLAGGRGLFGARGGGVGLYGDKTGMDFVTGGDGYYGKGGAKTYDGVADGAGKSVDGVLSPDEAGKMANGVSLSEDELVDGLVNSAFAGDFANGGSPGGLFADRMGLRDNAGLGTVWGLSGNKGLEGELGSDQMADPGARARALKGGGRAVNSNINLARASYGHYARTGGSGRWGARGAARGSMSGFKAAGAQYSRAFGASSTGADVGGCVDPVPTPSEFQDCNRLRGNTHSEVAGCVKGRRKLRPHSGSGGGSGGAGSNVAWQQNAEACVTGSMAASPAAANQGEFMAATSGAVYDGNALDTGGLNTPDAPAPMTPDMNEVDTLVDEANQMEEDARKCEEAESTYGPQERDHMSRIQELSDEANAKCAGGGCKDNASACRRINNQMRQECRAYNSVAAQKAAACPLQDGYEPMNCNQ